MSSVPQASRDIATPALDAVHLRLDEQLSTLRWHHHHDLPSPSTPSARRYRRYSRHSLVRYQLFFADHLTLRLDYLRIQACLTARLATRENVSSSRVKYRYAVCEMLLWPWRKFNDGSTAATLGQSITTLQPPPRPLMRLVQQYKLSVCASIVEQRRGGGVEVKE